MKVVLFEADVDVRSAVARQLRSIGCAVAVFADAWVALLFLLAHLKEVQGVFVNVDDPGQGTWLLQRLAFVSAPLAVATYSARTPKRGARMYRLLGPGA